MTFSIAALAIVAGIAALFVWGNRRTARAHARFTSKDVDAALSEMVSADARTHDTWDLFLSWPIDDPYLESIRQQCRKICDECPPAPGKDMNDEGERRIAALLKELRQRSGGLHIKN